MSIERKPLENDLKALENGVVDINDKIKLNLPTLREINNYGEKEYWALVSTLTATPYDYMLQLHKMGIRYEEWTDFMLFSLLLPSMENKMTSIVFGDLNVETFMPEFNLETGQLERLVNNDGIVIDEIIYQLIVDTLRQVHMLKRNWKIAGNEWTRNFYIQEAEENYQEQLKEKYTSTLSPLITSMVNCSDFKYTYETVMDINIYAFFTSMHQLVKTDHYRHLMTGIYTGNVEVEKITDKSSLSWLG